MCLSPCVKFFLVSEGEVHQRLCSASVLLIRRADVLQRLTPDSCLSSLSESQSDPRWKALDVEGKSFMHGFIQANFSSPENIVHVFLPVFFRLGQVRQMAREEEQEQERSQLTHITIPAAYSSGITLFALQESGLGQELLNAPELPLLWLEWHTWTQDLKLKDLFVVIWEIKLILWHFIEQKTDSPIISSTHFHACTFLSMMPVVFRLFHTGTKV